MQNNFNRVLKSDNPGPPIDMPNVVNHVDPELGAIDTETDRSERPVFSIDSTLSDVRTFLPHSLAFHSPYSNDRMKIVRLVDGTNLRLA